MLNGYKVVEGGCVKCDLHLECDDTEFCALLIGYDKMFKRTEKWEPCTKENTGLKSEVREIGRVATGIVKYLHNSGEFFIVEYDGVDDDLERMEEFEVKKDD